jgi:hypothetical protein
MQATFSVRSFGIVSQTTGALDSMKQALKHFVSSKLTVKIDRALRDVVNIATRNITGWPVDIARSWYSIDFKFILISQS